MAKVSDAHLEARRRSILDAATRVFSEKGVELATMAEVAAEAGISPGAIYRYFENKDELARGCMTESSDAIEEAWDHAPDPDVSDPMDDFQELARLTLKKINSPAARTDTKLSLEQILLMTRGDDTPDAKDFATHFLRIIDGVEARLKLAQDHGQLRRDVDTRAYAGALYSFYWGARLTRLVDPNTDTDAQLHALMRVLEDGTVPQAPALSAAAGMESAQPA